MSQPANPSLGQTAFYDSVAPALPTGEYQVIVQDTVTVDAETPVVYGTAQRFRVTGPQVAFGPGDVAAVSPPAGSQGSHDNWLPHVLLAQRSLPWQVAMPAPVGSTTTAVPARPWLALLLLTAQEIDVAGARPAANSTGTQTVPLGGYLAPGAGTLGPKVTSELITLQQEQPSLSCAVVDVTFEAFRAVAPGWGELPFLAHARQVDASDQQVLQVPAPGWYSVVMGNRLPTGAADGVYIAHLVSLEGFSDYLPDQAAPAGYSLVRLVSLASWTFTSGQDAGDFAYLAGNLEVAQLTVPISVTGTDEASKLVSAALADGYTLAGYTTRLGEQTAAWYRGPCQPAPVAANSQPAYQAASAALIYDPATGMFDASYAAAWEIGRLLTLANGPVSRSLADWVAAAVRAARLLLARSGTPGHPFEAAAADVPADALAPGARQRAVRRLVAERLVPALLGRGTGRAAFGLPADPTGLHGRDLPGVLDAQTLHQIAATGGDIHQAVVDHAVAAARARAAASDPAGPATGEEGS
jgi:hypothetical protein